tara:strand:+ start:35 stop:652 length:618 start_codon:yes stop_codon:yes gene_type:complete
MNYTDFNNYLFFEFGWFEEGDESQISEVWPYTFEKLDSFQIDGVKTDIYKFTEDEDYYLIDDNSLNFISSENLSINYLKLYLLGSAWIGFQKPIDLNTMDKRDPIIPSIPHRKECLKKIWTKYFDCDYIICEGLFLKKTQRYLGLGQRQDNKKMMVFGDGIIVRNIPFEDLSYSKRLSIGIGKLLNDGKINFQPHPTPCQQDAGG